MMGRMLKCGLIVVAIAFALTGATRAGSAPPAVQLDTDLPAWLAPGVMLTVRGTADPGTVIEVKRGAGTISSTTVGEDRIFLARSVLARLGVHRVTASSSDEVITLGTVLVRPLRLAAVGDVTFGDRVAEAIATRGPAYPWQSTGRILRSADVATANLEGAVSTRGTPAPDKQFHFRGPPS